MTSVNNVQDYLKDIADVIREKLGINELLNPQDFEDLMERIGRENPFKIDSMTSLMENGTNGDFLWRVDTSNTRIMNHFFKNWHDFRDNILTKKKTIEGIGDIYVLEVPQFDTSNLKNPEGCFEGFGEAGSCYAKIPELDFSKVSSVNSHDGHPFIKDAYVYSIGGFKDYGKELLFKSAHHERVVLDFSTVYNPDGGLSHDDMMNIINNLYDLTTTSIEVQDIIFRGTDGAKLTTEEIAIATNKGWFISFV